MEFRKCFTSFILWRWISVGRAWCWEKLATWLWCKLASGETTATTALRSKRRSEWQQTTRPLVKRVFEQAEKDFKEIIKLTNGGPNRQGFPGTALTNLESFTLTTHIEKTDIARTTYSPEKAANTTHLYERWGEVQVCQDHNGLIHIYFYPIELDTEDENMPPRQRLLYGRYEPWNLTEAKLKLAVAIGVNILLESRTGCRHSLYSQWVYKKNSQFYMGIILGAIVSWAISVL